jgi:VWFA-related protein
VRRFLLAALLALAPSARAQDVPTFASGVEFVRLTVTATHGDRLVTDLEARQFEVLEDGVRQKVELFHRRSAPLSLVLLLDTSGSMDAALERLQEAARHFVRGLGPDDAVQVAQLTSRLTVLQDFTADKAALEAAVRRTRPAGSTALYNALYSSIRTLRSRLAKDDARRQAIVVLSDGADNASFVGEPQVMTLARRNEVTVYAIGLDQSLQDAKAPTPALLLLKGLTVETGGTLLLPRRDLASACEEIALELRNQYTLGYASSNAARDGRWRRLEVRARDARGERLDLRHRQGYYAGGGPDAGNGVAALDEALARPSGSTPGPAAAVPLRRALRGYEPPVVTFALPESGDTVRSDGRLVIQFSTPMDAASFSGRVELRYAGAEEPLARVAVDYVEATRHVVIQPAEKLRRGSLECRLLAGIVDANGRPLHPRSGDGEGDAVEVLRFRVD